MLAMKRLARDWESFSTSPDISNFLPHLRLYEVVSLHMCVLPYKYRKILEMLPKLMKRVARDWESFSTSPDISNLLPHFRLYEVVSLHMSILPYKYRKILEMLPKLMKRLARDWESFSTSSARPRSIDLDVLGASLTARTRNCWLLVHVFYHNPYSRITFNQMQCGCACNAIPLAL